MKQAGFNLMLLIIVLSPLSAVCQRTDSNQTACGHGARSEIPVEEWESIQRLPWGMEVVVNSLYGPPLRCAFAGANDSTLFCDDAEHRADAGYAFERSRVIRVDVVRRATGSRREHHFHGRLLADAIVGTVVGLGVSRGGGAKAGALMGVAGALATEAVAEGVQP